MTVATIRELSKLDRCDRCSAAATVALQFKNGGELMFCGHHYTEHHPKLLSSGAIITGQTTQSEQE